jgi:integrase
MGYGEQRGTGRGTYYRGRYKTAPGKYATLPERFRTKTAAKQAADEAEARIRAQLPRAVPPEQLTFGAYCNRWYSGLDLAPSTMTNYRNDVETHLLPAFQDVLLTALLPADIEAWAKQGLAAGYRPSTVATWRATLHTILADAVEAGLLASNPATRRRGKGKRAGKSAQRGPEKVIASPLQALLIAERAAVLAGRQDEFALVTLLYWTGMRWAEAAGLETRYARLGSVRVEWQLYELHPAGFTRCPPKEDSYRDIDIPPWLSKLISEHIARTGPRPCPCHGLTYVFRGRRGSPHWWRSGFSHWCFEPAASGWFPARAPYRRRPVPLLAEPWPGRPVRGTRNQARGEMCWLPLAAGLTPHGLRHSHKSLMAQLRIPEVLSHERLGHQLGGIGGRYSHVTPEMRAELIGALTEQWEQALDARAAMAEGSPVPALDALLRNRHGGNGGTKIFSQDSPKRHREEVVQLNARPRRRA